MKKVKELHRITSRLQAGIKRLRNKGMLWLSAIWEYAMNKVKELRRIINRL